MYNVRQVLQYSFDLESFYPYGDILMRFKNYFYECINISGNIQGIPSIDFVFFSIFYTHRDLGDEICGRIFLTVYAFKSLLWCADFGFAVILRIHIYFIYFTISTDVNK